MKSIVTIHLKTYNYTYIDDVYVPHVPRGSAGQNSEDAETNDTPVVQGLA